MTLQELRAQQDDLYIKIADAKGDELDTLLCAVWEIEDILEEIENPPIPPLSVEGFESHYNVKREYERFHDEYGDAAASYNGYLKYHYDSYLSFHKNGNHFSF